MEKPFHSQASAQSTEPHHSGHPASLLPDSNEKVSSGEGGKSLIYVPVQCIQTVLPGMLVHRFPVVCGGSSQWFPRRGSAGSEGSGGSVRFPQLLQTLQGGPPMCPFSPQALSFKPVY